MSDPIIYNCHIHTFTNQHVPHQFLRLFFPRNWMGKALASIVTWLLGLKPLIGSFTRFARWRQRRTGNDILERQLRFLARGKMDSQAKILKGIQEQYPKGAKFIVLPMDMAFMELGDVAEQIDEQHKELLALANESQGCVIPFYAVDPRRDDIVDRVRKNLLPDRFRGVKIYPNLGYSPQCEKLMEVYAICQERGVPVMSHCSTGGVWKYGLTKKERMDFGNPRNYEKVLQQFPNLRFCLAHFGGSDEWARQLKGRTESEQVTWVKHITDMLSSGNYPNLYTDISYTAFAPRFGGLYFDFFDYLKVLLVNEQIRAHVLFGSDYYMVEREELSEKEVSIVLRSRLGEELYFQIAHHNPRRYLGIL